MKIPPTGDFGQIAIERWLTARQRVAESLKERPRSLAEPLGAGEQALLEAQQMMLINPDLGGIGAWNRSQRNHSRRQVS